MQEMNGEPIPGLMNRVREWIHQNQDPETGLVFGLTVGEPLEIQTSKTYRFTRNEGDFPVIVIVWDKGCLSLEKADFTGDLNAPNEEIIHSMEFEFDETEPLMSVMERFIKESLPK